MSKNLAFTVEFHVKPEYVQEFKDSLLYVLNSMSVEDTFVSCYLHKDPEDSTKFTVYEVWSEPSMDAFFKTQITKKYREDYEKNLPNMLQSERKITVLEPLQEWHK
jgi:quinol monooxygenase YgiN